MSGCRSTLKRIEARAAVRDFVLCQETRAVIKAGEGVSMRWWAAYIRQTHGKQETSTNGTPSLSSRWGSSSGDWCCAEMANWSFDVAFCCTLSPRAHQRIWTS
jgi:hypothetical protein